MLRIWTESLWVSVKGGMTSCSRLLTPAHVHRPSAATRTLCVGLPSGPAVPCQTWSTASPEPPLCVGTKDCEQDGSNLHFRCRKTDGQNELSETDTCILAEHSYECINKKVSKQICWRYGSLFTKRTRDKQIQFQLLISGKKRSPHIKKGMIHFEGSFLRC